MPLHALAEDNLAAASPDLLRAMAKTSADALMSAEADARRTRRTIKAGSRRYPGKHRAGTIIVSS